MFDFIKKLFGEGKIEFRATLSDGRTMVGQVPYIGDINTLGDIKFENYVKMELFSKYGVIVKNVNIIGWY